MYKINYLFVPLSIFVIVGIIFIWGVTDTKHLLLPDDERAKVYQQENYEMSLRVTQNAFDELFSEKKSMDSQISPIIVGRNTNMSLQESVNELNDFFIKREGEVIPDDQIFLPSLNNSEIKYLRVYPPTYVQFRRKETASLKEINQILPPSTSISSLNNLGKDTIVLFENLTNKCSINLQTKKVDCEDK